MITSHQSLVIYSAKTQGGESRNQNVTVLSPAQLKKLTTNNLRTNRQSTDD